MFSNSFGDSGNIKIVENARKKTNNFLENIKKRNNSILGFHP